MAELTEDIRILRTEPGTCIVGELEHPGDGTAAVHTSSRRINGTHGGHRVAQGQKVRRVDPCQRVICMRPYLRRACHGHAFLHGG
eukprot:35130-Eustigmatos_ZCMA.PRE.1